MEYVLMNYYKKEQIIYGNQMKCYAKRKEKIKKNGQNEKRE